MNLTIFRVMLRGLLRDSGALALTFLVPAVFFLVFASVFAASSGGNFEPRVAVSVEHPAGQPDSLLEMMRAGGGLRLDEPAGGEVAVRALVRRGRADAGLLVRRTAPGARPTFVVVSDPARAVAAQLHRAHVERAYATRYLMPPILSGGKPLGARVDLETVTGAAAGANEVAYSAGAVALLFLLLSAVHGAVEPMWVITPSGSSTASGDEMWCGFVCFWVDECSLYRGTVHRMLASDDFCNPQSTSQPAWIVDDVFEDPETGRPVGVLRANSVGWVRKIDDEYCCTYILPGSEDFGDDRMPSSLRMVHPQSRKRVPQSFPDNHR